MGLDGQGMGVAAVLAATAKVAKEIPVKVDSIAAIGFPAASWWFARAADFNSTIGPFLVTFGGLIFLGYKIYIAHHEARAKKAEADRAERDNHV